VLSFSPSPITILPVSLNRLKSNPHGINGGLINDVAITSIHEPRCGERC